MRSILLFLVPLVFFSCQKKRFDSTKQLLEFIQDEDNGYVFSATVQDVDYQVLYKPTDLIVSQMLVDTSKVDVLRNEISKFLYFNLSISKGGREVMSSYVSDKNKFGTLLNNLAFNIDKKVVLTTSQHDTIPMVDFIYPRMYGMTEDTSMLLVFSKEKKVHKDEDLTFTIKDLEIDSGEIQFKISSNRLLNQPQLNIKQ